MTRWIKRLIASILAAGLALSGLFWVTFRVYVPPDSCAVLIRKMGRPLPPGQLVATEPGQRGILAEPLGPGRYFYNPIWWDYEIKPLLHIPSGDPKSWEWIHSLDHRQRDELRAGTFAFKGEFPKIGVVTRKVGKEPPPGQIVVSRASGMRGVLEEVLTPGTYRLNPYVYEVDVQPAVVVPAGFVGVVTNLFGTQPQTPETPMLPELSGLKPPPVTGASTGQQALLPEPTPASFVRPLAEPGERGTLRDVLQPGVYFNNPKLQKVTIVEVGFNEYSQIQTSKTDNEAITFPSETGFLIQLGVTVVWGINPRHAAEVINEFGNVDAVVDNVIQPQLRSICRNIGSTYAARDFIQGEKRERFQHDLTTGLKRVCRAKNIEILLALVRELEVHAPAGTVSGAEVTEDLKRTIQQSYVAIEQQLTKGKQRDAAAVRAQLEQERKKVEIARESVKGDTGVRVAGTLAEGQKQAAQIDAQADLEVATIMQEVALLEAKRTQLLGQANADVERMKKEAEAKGYELLVNAFGGGQAYNLYTFAENFKPESIRLFFAGEGTFWTDLARFQELGPAVQLQQAGKK